jgi:hypothetical protein
VGDHLLLLFFDGTRSEARAARQVEVLHDVVHVLVRLGLGELGEEPARHVADLARRVVQGQGAGSRHHVLEDALLPIALHDAHLDRHRQRRFRRGWRPPGNGLPFAAE